MAVAEARLGCSEQGVDVAETGDVARHREHLSFVACRNRGELLHRSCEDGNARATFDEKLGGRASDAARRPGYDGNPPFELGHIIAAEATPIHRSEERKRS